MTWPTEGDAPVTAAFWRQNRFACIAFLLAFVALALVILPPYIFHPPRSPLGAVRGLLRALSTNPDEALVAYEARMQYFEIGSVAVAIVAGALALASVVRRERRTLALAALGVAAVAILWHYVVVGIVVAVILAILLSLLN
jgi:hypothetical protein